MSTAAAPINLESTVVQHPALMSSEMGEEVVMMVLEKSAYYALDDIGSTIWRLISVPITVNQLCFSLIEKFDVPLEQCQIDVLGFLNDIYEQNLIDIVF
jgi:Coenzyme PQQ synthesis protein D (PqqD)